MVDAPGSSTITWASYATSNAFLESSAYTFFNGPTVGAAAAYAAMRSYAANPHVAFQALLPELNVSDDLNTSTQAFAGLATGFRTPVVSDFTTFTSGSSATSSNIIKLTDVQPEYNYTYEAGYRYHDRFFVGSATAYLQDVNNYQAEVQIDPADYITDNIGTVKIYGVDFEAGTKPWHGFTFYASGEVQRSYIGSNITADYEGSYPNDTIQYVATMGKQLVDTPDWLFSASLGYAQEGLFGNLIPHCWGQRATAFLKDEWVPANCTLDAIATAR